MGIRGAVTVGFLAAVTIIFTPYPASAACEPQSPGAAPAKGDYWAQQRFNLGRLPAGADGAGITVAVLDSGVDAKNPLLSGRVLAGRDLLHGRSDGQQDCVGHGTAVATLIAGHADGDFRGVAPGARILPVRVSERTRPDDTRAQTATPAELANAIDYAISAEADVINMSFAITGNDAAETDFPAVRAAVARAVAADIVVVAAVGNEYPQRLSYPAGYPGVLGVGAVTADGKRQQASMTGSFVAIAAPGERIVTGWPGGALTVQSGTSFAAPLVSGAAALVRQAHRGWSAARVIDQLTGTADPSLGGADSGSHGAGVVNPVRALTESTATSGTRAYALPPLATPVPDGHVLAAQRRDERRRHTAWALGGVGTLIAVAVLAGGAVLGRGTRRRWRPASS